MPILIGTEGLTHEWPGKPVATDVTLGINEGDRIGVVGRNGEGKTTLLSLLAKRLNPDAGSITYRTGITVGVLGQSDSLDDASSVERAVVGDVPEYVWASRPRTREIISALLDGIDWQGGVGELSGGQRRRVDLAHLLIGDWDVLMLDEPTNHLDMPAITWLAAHLNARWPAGTGALLCVTHDRWFLDEVCQSMWEVHDGQVDPFEGGFSAYVQQRVERDRQAAASEARRQNQLRRELAWLSRGAQARSSKPKFRIAEAQSLVADVPPLRNPIELRSLAVSRLGKQVVELKGVTVSYPGTPDVLDDVSWLVGPGDRYGILGANGAGKSTLLKVIKGELAPTSGVVKIGKSVRFGTMSQQLDSLMERSGWRVGELLARYRQTYRVDGKDLTPQQLLERLGFERAALLTRIGSLSGGQRRRLALMCVLLEEPNVLVLDEPGNDLDTDMLAVMEDLLDGWPGTLFLVSHDRYLMERVTDDQFALVGGRLRHVPGGVDEFLGLAARERGPAVAQPEPEAGETTMSGLSNSERQTLKRRLESVTRRLGKLREEPAAIEGRMAEAEPSDYAALEALDQELRDCREQIEDFEDEWLELSERLEG
jgi:ATPase subunit of ABC transporter with duplicated ATPase domains